jgi:hypothetical protein
VLHVEEQLRHLLRLGGVDGEDGGGSLLCKRFQLFDIASGESYLQADLRQAPRERSADARSGSDDYPHLADNWRDVSILF